MTASVTGMAGQAMGMPANDTGFGDALGNAETLCNANKNTATQSAKPTLPPSNEGNISHNEGALQDHSTPEFNLGKATDSTPDITQDIFKDVGNMLSDAVEAAKDFWKSIWD